MRNFSFLFLPQILSLYFLVLLACKVKEEPFVLFVSWHPPHDWGKFKGEDGKMHYRYDAPGELMAYYNRDSIKVRSEIKSTPELRRMYNGHLAMTPGK